MLTPISPDGAVFFGSSVTGKVYALDAATGDVRWTFFAEGPVRFAPTVVDKKVYFGSDDGYAYCLDAKDGKLVVTGEKDGDWIFADLEYDNFILRYEYRIGCGCRTSC